MVRELAKSLHWSRGVYQNRSFDNAPHSRFIGDGHRSARAAGILFGHFKGRYEAHKRWARWTYPIWLYVSVTEFWFIFRFMFGFRHPLLRIQALIWFLGNPFCVRPSVRFRSG